MKLLFLLVFFPFFSFSQINPIFVEPTKQQTDSLHLLLQTTTNDTIRMAAYRDLALYNLDVNADTARYFVEHEIPITQQLKLRLWEADALDLYSIILTTTGNYTESLKTITAGIKIAEDENSEKNIWRIEKFSPEKNHSIARRNMLAVLQLDLSGVYRENHYLDKEAKALQDCQETALSVHDYTILSHVCRNIGRYYMAKNNTDSALTYLYASLDYAKKIAYKKYTGLTYLLLANVYSIKGNFKESRQNLDTSIIFNREQNIIPAVGSAYTSISNLFVKTGDTDSALYYSKKGLDLVKNAGRISTLVEAYLSLSNVYGIQHKSDSALIYLKLANSIKDSLESADNIKQFQNIGFDEQIRLEELEKEKIETQNKTRTYAMLLGISVVLLVALILYRNNLQKKKANKVLEATLSNLKSTQTQLIQSEKLASFGELTAGIAHEIQNPLNFVNNFSEVNRDLLNEMKEELDKGNLTEVKSLADDVIENEKKINHHGKRADAIVKGMLQHSQSNRGVKELTNINELAEKYSRLSYHGFKAKEKTLMGGKEESNVHINTDFDQALSTPANKINIIPQDIGRVIMNLMSNAFYASSAALAKGSVPTISIQTKKTGNMVEIKISDNGPGIADEILDKIFQPFFTTKPTGQGTGLGLSLSYDIITKGHGGELTVKTRSAELGNENTGSEFIILLPA